MSLILNIETATDICSVALAREGKLISLKETKKKRSHSDRVTILIQQAMDEANCTLEELSAIAISKGPGSYTGLRIGVSTAKGLCYSLDKPLISVSTLQGMALGMFLQTKEEDVLYCPMIDARRMEVYTGFYNHLSEEIIPVSADIIDEHSYSHILKNNKVNFFGDGSFKCKDILSNHENARFIKDFTPSAKYMVSLSYKALQEDKLEDVAYFEPFYLKDFVSGADR